MTFPGRTLHRAGSGQSLTSLDGIKFRIADECKPPRKVTLPISFEMGNPTEALFMEYDFSREEAYLDWLRQHKEAERALDVVETDRVATTIQDFAQQPTEQPTQPPDDNEPDAEIPAHSSTNPFYAGFNNSILTPIIAPVTSGGPTTTGTATGSSGFNVADFERESDPFDNLELETIDDMVELNKVLGGTTMSSATATQNHVVGSQNHLGVGQNHVQNNLGMAQNNLGIGQNHAAGLQNHFSPPQNQATTTHLSSQDRNTGSPSQTRLHNVQYPDIFSNSPPRGHRSPQPSSSYSSSVVNLPPITASRNFVQQQPLKSSEQRLHVNLNSRTVGFSCGSESGQLRSALSSPDMASLLSDEGPNAASHAYSSSKAVNGATSVGNEPKPSSNSAPNSRSTTPVKSDIVSLLPNPYASLSGDERRLVDTLVVMGFTQSRTARTVIRLGLDDKQVVDFMCKVNRLSDQGFSPDDAEIALISFNADETKVKSFLELLGQYQELGFEKSKIKDALIKAELDPERSLDILTGT